LSESQNAFFSAFVDGYSFKTDNSSQDDSDYLVFSSGSDKSIQLEYHAFQHTWGASGETDSFVYALAREFEDPSTESPDDYTSVLVRLASNDVSYVDQINDGTLDIGIITAG